MYGVSGRSNFGKMNLEDAAYDKADKVTRQDKFRCLASLLFTSSSLSLCSSSKATEDYRELS